MLPTQSLCLTVPVVWPQEWNEPWAKRRRTEICDHNYWVEAAAGRSRRVPAPLMTPAA